MRPITAVHVLQVVPLHATFLLRGGKGCCKALTSEQCHHVADAVLLPSRQQLIMQELACLRLPIPDPTALSLTSHSSISSVVYPISAAFTGPVCFNASTSLSDLTIKFDTACSHNMSGNSDRLSNTNSEKHSWKRFQRYLLSCCNSWSQQRLHAQTLYPQYAL